jgi:hypothetical protein
MSITKPLRNEIPEMLAGNWSAGGIGHSPIRIAITGIPRFRAYSTSVRTKSPGLSMRRSPFAVSPIPFDPIITKKLFDSATCSAE